MTASMDENKQSSYQNIGRFQVPMMSIPTSFADTGISSSCIDDVIPMFWNSAFKFLIRTCFLVSSSLHFEMFFCRLIWECSIGFWLWLVFHCFQKSVCSSLPSSTFSGLIGSRKSSGAFLPALNGLCFVTWWVSLLSESVASVSSSVNLHWESLTWRSAF